MDHGDIERNDARLVRTGNYPRLHLGGLGCLAVAAPAWLQVHLHPAWGDRYSHRVEHYRLPKTEAERQQLAATIGTDGFILVHAAYAPEVPPKPRQHILALPRFW